MPFPEGVRIERRQPTNEECIEVAGKAFGYREQLSGLMESTWAGVVAESPEGATVGALRIMRDAPGWFSIWDVAVLPEWQGRRIGTTMMKHAVDMIREASPKANVYLFTFKCGFYERLGFVKESVSMLRL